ncbi:MAG TPA: hypothetical protein VHG90_02990 [Acidimicrobiales bacterium]|nr:hypothetical protein [Acidimicrobiales bacterium]
MAAHVVVSGVWLGAVVTNRFLGVSATLTGSETLADGYYAAMDTTVNHVMPAAALATFATGLVLALATRWGLFRHWWVITKFVLAIVTVVVGVAIIDPAVRDTIETRARTGSTGFSPALLPAVVATPLMLLSATVIAIIKPWGRTSRPRRQPREPAE